MVGVKRSVLAGRGGMVRPGARPRGPGRVRNGRGTSVGDVRYGGNSDGQGRRGQVVRCVRYVRCVRCVRCSVCARPLSMSHNWRLISSHTLLDYNEITVVKQYLFILKLVLRYR